MISSILIFNENAYKMKPTVLVVPMGVLSVLKAGILYFIFI
jgi:hypothetical protein